MTRFSASKSLSFLLVSALLLSSCGGNGNLFTPAQPDVIDPQKNLTRGDYAHVLDPNAEDQNQPSIDSSFHAKDDGPPIPDLAPILSSPQEPKIAETKLVSVSAMDDTPVKDVLMELARKANINIEVDPNITGGVMLHVEDQPFNEVVQEITDLAGLRYTMKNGVLRVERDTQYVEIYSLPFIAMDRSSNNSVNISTNVLGSSVGGGSSGGSSSGGGSSGGSSSGGLNSGSQTSISTKSDSDFWKQFDSGLKQILAFQPGMLRTGLPAPTPVAAPTASSSSGGPKDSNTFYVINKQAGTLTVSATQRQQELVKRFVTEISANASAQVLIEAKIVEVDLNQQFQSGIDWSKLGSSRLGITGASFSPLTAGITSFTAASGATLNATTSGAFNGFLGDLSVAVSLLDQFGTTRTLASPRLHAINNQQAVLTYAENYVYFSVTATQASTTSINGVATITPPTINVTPETVPIGIILNLQPSIDLKTGEVTLDVRPTYSILVTQIPDPGVALILAENNITDPGIQNQVPVVAVREMDSIVKLKTGGVAVIGGYMEDKVASNDNGLPYAGNVPLVGDLFKSTDRERHTSELVILLRATIVDSNGGVPDADKAVYKKFIEDPNPAF